MKKIIAFLAAFAVVMAPVLATNTDVTWDGAGSVSAEMSNSVGESRVEGLGQAIEGEFHADDNSYGRVESSTRGEYQNGGYDLQQTNKLKSGSSSSIRAWSDGHGSGSLDANTDAWGAGNDLKANGNDGHSWSWSGTDEQIVRAESGSFDIGMYAGRDDNNNGTDDSSYGIRVRGNEKAGIGAENAGSTEAVSGSSVSADLIARGEGDGEMTQQFKNSGKVEVDSEWN